MSFEDTREAVLAWLSGARDGVSRQELVGMLMADISDLHEDGYEVTISTDPSDPDRAGMLADVDAGIRDLEELLGRITPRLTYWVSANAPSVRSYWGRV